jgi:IclR family transcriptional regulator, acetate operon repressor
MSKIVERTLDFIELFAQQKRPLTLSEITRLLEIPSSSCHDVLQALQARGYLVEVGPRAGFYPTRRLLNLATEITQHDPVLMRAEARLRAVRDRLDESVSLAKATGMRVTYLLVLDASHPLRFHLTVGSELRSLHATSAGKAFLASLRDDELDAYLRERVLAPMTPRTITVPDLLRSDLRDANRRGWFLNREESEPGATTLSGRFIWNRSVYIVTVAGPVGRMEPKLDEAARCIVSACLDLDESNAA